MAVWKPHPRQELALQRAEYEVMYGGARGGGKTDTGLVWLTECVNNPLFRGLVIRKNADDLSDWVDRAGRMFATFGATIAYRPAIISFPSGAVIKTGHLKDDQAYTKYQGHEYQRMLIEELTQIPTEKRYLELLSSCRSTVPNIPAQIFNTTNPGGVGHGWVKKRFIDPVPPETAYADPTSGRKRIFIPATVEDNPTLMQADPGYVKSLDALKDTDIELWKAWRMGDWETFAGQFFREWSKKRHTCPRFIPKKGMFIIGGLDWGRTAPFAFHCVALERVEGDVPFHRAWTFLEVYGTQKTPAEWGKEIKEKLANYDLTLNDIDHIEADPAIFTKGQDGSISIRDQFIALDNRFVVLRAASNDRIGGWENLHNWMSLAPDGYPYWLIAENCVNLIEELPNLVHDDPNVEDVDTQSVDHASDDQRYALKSLKWIDARLGGVGKTPEKKKASTAEIDPRTGKQMSIDPSLFSKVKRRR